MNNAQKNIWLILAHLEIDDLSPRCITEFIDIIDALVDMTKWGSDEELPEWWLDMLAMRQDLYALLGKEELHNG